MISFSLCYELFFNFETREKKFKTAETGDCKVECNREIKISSGM